MVVVDATLVVVVDDVVVVVVVGGSGARSKRANEASLPEAVNTESPSALTTSDWGLSSPEFVPLDVALPIWPHAPVPVGPVWVSPVRQPW